MPHSASASETLQAHCAAPFSEVRDAAMFSHAACESAQVANDQAAVTCPHVSTSHATVKACDGIVPAARTGLRRLTGHEWASRRRLAWAFAGGWLLGITILLIREVETETAPLHHWQSRAENVYTPGLHPLVVGVLQGLGSVLALITLERARPRYESQ